VLIHEILRTGKHGPLNLPDLMLEMLIFPLMNIR
jgi:hypothetical protein